MAQPDPWPTWTLYRPAASPSGLGRRGSPSCAWWGGVLGGLRSRRVETAAVKNAGGMGLGRERARTASQGAESFQEIPSCSYRPSPQPRFPPRTCTPHSVASLALLPLPPLSRGKLSHRPQEEQVKESCRLWETCWG